MPRPGTRLEAEAGRQLFDRSDAPFAETLVPAESTNTDANAARVRLQAVLDELKPIAAPLVASREKTEKDDSAPVTTKKRKKKKPPPRSVRSSAADPGSAPWLD